MSFLYKKRNPSLRIFYISSERKFPLTRRAKGFCDTGTFSSFSHSLPLKDIFFGFKIFQQFTWYELNNKDIEIQFGIRCTHWKSKNMHWNDKNGHIWKNPKTADRCWPPTYRKFAVDLLTSWTNIEFFQCGDFRISKLSKSCSEMKCEWKLLPPWSWRCWKRYMRHHAKTIYLFLYILMQLWCPVLDG